MDIGSSQALLQTVRELLARGHALEAVLPAFTSNIARLLRLPGKGAIAVGADADLLALDAAGEVREVMARGVWHVRAGRAVRRGLFESAEPDRV
jgi:beta-aspartyl-dipeptidase (metallo-type)